MREGNVLFNDALNKIYLDATESLICSKALMIVFKVLT